MEEATALGTVLAMLVDGAGKPVRGGFGKGQLYAGREGLLVLRPTAAAQAFHVASGAALLASVVLVVANLFLWKRQAALWVAIALQAAYWIGLPARRRSLEPQPLAPAALAEARRSGRAFFHIPADAIVRTVPPEPPRRGFRKPARFELPDGALEVYLSEEQFRSAVAALGRAA